MPRGQSVRWTNLWAVQARRFSRQGPVALLLNIHTDWLHIRTRLISGQSVSMWRFIDDSVHFGSLCRVQLWRDWSWIHLIVAHARVIAVISVKWRRKSTISFTGTRLIMIAHSSRLLSTWLNMSAFKDFQVAQEVGCCEPCVSQLCLKQIEGDRQRYCSPKDVIEYRTSLIYCKTSFNVRMKKTFKVLIIKTFIFRMKKNLSKSLWRISYRNFCHWDIFLGLEYRST